MFEPTDNNPEFWPKKQKGNLMIERISFAEYRRRLIYLAKFAMFEYLNGGGDFDQIIDNYLELESHPRGAVK